MNLRTVLRSWRLQIIVAGCCFLLIISIETLLLGVRGSGADKNPAVAVGGGAADETANVRLAVLSETPADGGPTLITRNDGQLETQIAVCDQYRQLLHGVDVSVIEMPKRAGQVQRQMQQFHTGSSVTAVPAVTPSTIIGEGVTPQTLAAECASKPEGQLPYGPFHVADTAFSTTLSHVKALKQTCARPDHKDLLLVLEVSHCIRH